MFRGRADDSGQARGGPIRGWRGRYDGRMAAAAPDRRIAIRPLRASDVGAARRVERDAYGAASPRTAFARELRNGLAQYLAAAFEPPPEASAPRRLLARLGLASPPEALAGYAGAWFTPGQLHLVTLAVAPALQGRGVGEALLLAVCGLAAEAELDSVALEVRPSNARAIALYERCGFRPCGRLRRYYAGDGEDAIPMLLEGLAAPAGRAALDRLRADHARRAGARFAAAG